MGLLQTGWLAVELDAVESDIEAWSAGLRDSFHAAIARTQAESPSELNGE